MARIWLKGRDSVASFIISRTTCDYCDNNHEQLCVTYNGPVTYKTWTWDDIFQHTIMGGKAVQVATKHHRNVHLGLQCGDYAKFQRQIARITQSMERKAAV